MQFIIPLVLFVTSIYVTSLPTTSEARVPLAGSLNEESAQESLCPNAQLNKLFTKAQNEGKLVYASNRIKLSLLPRDVQKFASKSEIFLFGKQEFSYHLASWYKSIKSLTDSSIKVRLSFQGDQTKFYNGTYNYNLNFSNLDNFEDFHDNKYHIVLSNQVAYPASLYVLLVGLEQKSSDWDQTLLDLCDEEKSITKQTWFCKSVLDNEKDVKSIPKRLVFHLSDKVHGDWSSC